MYGDERATWPAAFHKASKIPLLCRVSRDKHARLLYHLYMHRAVFRQEYIGSLYRNLKRVVLRYIMVFYITNVYP